MFCGKCKTEKAESEFAKDRTRKNGYQPYCKTCRRTQTSQWAKNNPERMAQLQSSWYERNSEEHRRRALTWARTNRGRHAAKTARRKATLLQATPKWANLEAIDAIYNEAAKLGMTVDHVIPLKGKRVCGLHVETNMQLLTKSANSRKRNVF